MRRTGVGNIRKRRSSRFSLCDHREGSERGVLASGKRIVSTEDRSGRQRIFQFWRDVGREFARLTRCGCRRVVHVAQAHRQMTILVARRVKSGIRRVRMRRGHSALSASLRTGRRCVSASNSGQNDHHNCATAKIFRIASRSAVHIWRYRNPA